MLRQTLIALGALVLLGAGVPAPFAQANGTDTEIVLSVDEACPGDRERCFALEEGELEGLDDGHGIRLVLENTDDEPHTVHVATLGDADPDRKATPSEASFASTDTVPPGEQGVLAFAPPSHADGVYLWDEIEGQEARGLWLAVPYGEEPTGLAEAQQAPLPTGALLVGFVLVAWARGPSRSDG